MGTYRKHLISWVDNSKSIIVMPSPLVIYLLVERIENSTDDYIKCTDF